MCLRWAHSTRHWRIHFQGGLLMAGTLVLSAESPAGAVDRSQGLWFLSTCISPWASLVSAQHGNWVPRASVPEEPDRGCRAFPNSLESCVVSLPLHCTNWQVTMFGLESRRGVGDRPAYQYKACQRLCGLQTQHGRCSSLRCTFVRSGASYFTTLNPPLTLCCCCCF